MSFNYILQGDGLLFKGNTQVTECGLYSILVFQNDTIKYSLRSAGSFQRCGN